MEFRAHEPSKSLGVEILFSSVFTASERASEDALIRNLAKELIANSDRHDLYGFVAVERGQMVGAILFSRLHFETEIVVFLLAPGAVHSEYQGQGAGEAFIRHGLQELKQRRKQIVVTYGDAAFYARVGVQPLSTERISRLVELSQPDGWLGQFLTEAPVEPVAGPCSWVEASQNPVYW